MEPETARRVLLRFVEALSQKPEQALLLSRLAEFDGWSARVRALVERHPGYALASLDPGARTDGRMARKVYEYARRTNESLVAVLCLMPADLNWWPLVGWIGAKESLDSVLEIRLCVTSRALDPHYQKEWTRIRESVRTAHDLLAPGGGLPADPVRALRAVQEMLRKTARSMGRLIRHLAWRPKR